MIEIRPNALYSRSDLLEMLQPMGIDPDAWIGRIRPVKRFRMAWWGEDLIEAIRKAPAMGENEPAELPAAKNRGNGRSRKTTRQRGGASTIDGYLQELKVEAKR